MKTNIRSRIVAMYVSLLLIPLAVIIFSVVIIQSNDLPIPGFRDYRSIENNANRITSIIEENIDNGTLNAIDTTEYTDEFNRYFNQVLFKDPNEMILYDSKSIWTGIHYSKFSQENYSLNVITRPLNDGDQLIGFLVFVPKITFQQAITILTTIPILLLVIIIGTIIAMFVFLTRIISEGIIKPLDNLYEAADEIAHGNLDFEMEYDADSELGVFCHEFDQMRVRLKESLDQQKEYERARKELLASVSHDLKTPLTSIKGYVEAIQDGIVTNEETYNKYLNIIVDKADGLNHLIDDLFVFSKMELGEFTVNMEKHNSERLLSKILDSREYEFQNSKIQFIQEKPFISTYISVDAYRMAQVIENIINNAKKFTRSFIKVRTTVRNYKLMIVIEDDGIGIKEEDLPYIFDHFFKVDKSRSYTATQGSGLGLAISKQLIQAQHGSIYVDSTYGEGSKFIIELPIIR